MQVIVTMDWKETEREVIRKWQNLEATIDLYTANDIEANFDEAEYKEKLKAIEETYKEVNASIKDFLQDYEEKEFWKNQNKEILNLVKSHQRQLRSAVTRVKGNVTAPASISSVST